ncbi:MAG TPA: histidine kinase dimerization/phospho-acceptor domain-containing protein [Gemmatimonadales bacterium]|nr:histidine kinase dimerization/phospho-acceptor domain-containing protein [Gemmatimonadales bacterium]
MTGKRQPGPQMPRRSAGEEEELRHARALAEGADHAKSAFLASMSHELRTPLNAIIGFAELLDEQTAGPLTERQRKYVHNIVSSGRHLLHLVNQVLQLTRVEVGHVRLSVTRFDPRAALRDVVTLVEGLAQKKRLDLAVEVEDASPVMAADEPKFKQIVYNLLDTAIRFTPDGGRITVAARAAPPDPAPGPGDWLVVTIGASGLLTPAEAGDTVPGDLELGGPEMGLALARRLVELHDGRMSVASAVGEGSALSVALPVASEARRSQPASPVPDFAAADSGGGPLVLVIEDDRQLSELLADYLTEGGYGVAHAASAEEGLRLARELQPAAITLDIALPDRDGLEVLAALKSSAETRDTPVVVVSVTDRRGLRSAQGAVAWLVKPVDRASLLGVLRRAVPEGEP